MFCSLSPFVFLYVPKKTHLMLKLVFQRYLEDQYFYQVQIIFSHKIAIKSWYRILVLTYIKEQSFLACNFHNFLPCNSIAFCTVGSNISISFTIVSFPAPSRIGVMKNEKLLLSFVIFKTKLLVSKRFAANNHLLSSPRTEGVIDENVSKCFFSVILSVSYCIVFVCLLIAFLGFLIENNKSFILVPIFS